MTGTERSELTLKGPKPLAANVECEAKRRTREREDFEVKATQKGRTIP